MNNVKVTFQSFSSDSIAKHSVQSECFHLRERTVSIAGREIISHAIFTNLFNLHDIVKYQSLSKNHKSPVLYRCFQSISMNGDSNFLSTYHPNIFNHLTYIIPSFLAGNSSFVSISNILTLSHRIGNHTVPLLIFALRFSGFTAMIGLHSVIQYHSIIVAFGDFLENFVNKSFGHLSAQTTAIRRELS
ncbi:hypothetical protein J6T66_04140 [bacterium]|nr:hypothetical protein [bacterium]